MSSTPQNVAILGATQKPGRYARKAQELLTRHGHRVFPVTIRPEKVLGVESYQSLDAIEEKIDTVTVYVRPEHLESYIQPMISKQVGRVILNPGTESELHEAELRAAGIEVIRACTLVLLSTDQF